MLTDRSRADNFREDGSQRGHERSALTRSSTQVDRGYGTKPLLDWETEPQQKSFHDKRPGGFQGFAKEHNLRLAAPTARDYNSDGAGFSFPGSPGTPGTPGKMERWKSFKISSLFGRFRRQSTMPNPVRLPVSPLQQKNHRSLDDIFTTKSETFMVSYDSGEAVASPKKVISIKGLIKLCGKDTCGRPIVVIDTSCCPPPSMRFVALGHIREKMEPVVESGEYNIVFVMSPNPISADASKDVPAMWCLEVYRKLPYYYKKNVKRVVLIHPTFVVNLVSNLLRPFMSSKAHEKIVRVHQLADLDRDTNGEITLDMLYLAEHVYLHDTTLAVAEDLQFTPDP